MSNPDLQVILEELKKLSEKQTEDFNKLTSRIDTMEKNSAALANQLNSLSQSSNINQTPVPANTLPTSTLNSTTVTNPANSSTVVPTSFSGLKTYPLIDLLDSWDEFQMTPINVPDTFPKFRCRDSLKSFKDPTEFMEEFRKAALSRSYQIQRWPQILLGCLEPVDSTWYETFLNNNWKNSLTWEKICAEFIDHFQDKNNRTLILNEIRALRMRDSLQRFSDTFIKLMNQIGLQPDDESTVSYFLNGIPPGLRKNILDKYMITDEPLNVLKCIEYAYEVESKYKLYNLSTASGTPTTTSRDTPIATTPKKTLVCDYCHNRGHIEPDCRIKAKQLARATPANNPAGNPAPTVSLQVNNAAPVPTPKNTVKGYPKTPGNDRTPMNKSNFDYAKNMATHETPIEEVICFNCFQHGHFREKCTAPKTVASYTIDRPESIPKPSELLTTLCLINGKRLTAMVDSGANASVIDRKWVIANDIPIISSEEGIIKEGLGTIKSRIGYVENIELRNGHKKINVSMEVADIADYDLIIGLDLFEPLSYKITGIPFAYPDSDDIPEQRPKVASIPIDRPPELDENGIHPSWRKVLEDNQKLPETSRCKLPNAELSLPTTGKPRYRRQYRIPYAYRNAVTKQVMQWILEGVIELAPPDTEWNHPLIAVWRPGKNGKPPTIRVCLDAQSLNEVLLVDVDNSIPTIQDVFDANKFFKWISALDLRGSYLQFPIKQEDRHKLTFTWNGVRYMFNCVPFGVRHMSSHLQRAMELLLSKYGVTPYQDDSLISSQSDEEHIETVRLVLEALTYEAGLRLNLDKCEFFCTEAKVLGHLLTRDGIKKDPAKIKAVKEFPLPATVTDLQRFMGAVNFYRNFSPKFAEICAPLDSLRNGKGAITWSESLVTAFEAVKNHFCEDMLLRNIDFTKDLYLTTDASLTGMGAWIGQYDDSRTELLPVLCASKKFSAAQQRWSATKRELWGLMWAMNKFDRYLRGRKFIARVDHKPLIYMVKNQMNNLTEGWLDTIMNYDFTCEYLPGQQNDLADALSRSNADITVCSLQISDKETILIREAEKRGKTIPDADTIKTLIENAHADGHFGVEMMYKKLYKLGFWWFNMRNDLRKYVRSCMQCLRYDTTISGYHPMVSIEADKPWDHVEIDLIGPLPESRGNYLFIFTLVDVLTGYCIVRPLRSKTMEEIAAVFWSIISEYGAPKILQSDNGKEFVNELMSAIVSLYGIDQRLITAYHPRANGLVERMNKEVSRNLKKLVDSAYEKWEEYLPTIQMSLNNRFLRRINGTPFELMHGREFNKFVNYRNAKSISDMAAAVTNRTSEINILNEVIFPAVATRVSKLRETRNMKYDKSVKIVDELEPGTIVMAVDKTKASKWDAENEGPFTIVRRTEGGAYVLADKTGVELGRRVNIENLTVVPKTDTLVTENFSDAAVVSEILEHRYQKGSSKDYEYLVKWLEDDTPSWVKSEDFYDKDIIKEYWNGALPNCARPKGKPGKKISEDDFWNPADADEVPSDDDIIYEEPRKKKPALKKKPASNKKKLGKKNSKEYSLP